LSLQISLQQEGAEIRERGDRLRLADVGAGELDPVADRRVVVRSDQVAQGFRDRVPRLDFDRQKLIAGPDKEILLQRTVLAAVIVEVVT